MGRKGPGRGYRVHAARRQELAAVSVPPQLGPGATITKMKAKAQGWRGRSRLGLGAEPGGATCAAPGSGGCARQSWPHPQSRGSALCTRGRTFRETGCVPHYGSTRPLAHRPRKAPSAKLPCAGFGLPRSVGPCLLAHGPRKGTCAELAVLRGTRRARSANLPHAESRATQTEEPALPTPGARFWGAPQRPPPRLLPLPAAAPSLHLDLGLRTSTGTQFP